MEPPDRAVPPRLRPHPYSCTSLWWKEHTSTRLSRSVAPPRSHHTMWCAWVNRRAPHPGKVHSRSRYLSWRIIHSGGSRVTRPRPTTWPARSSITVWTRPVHSRRRAVSGWMAGPPSISHPPVPSTSPSRRAWMITVARSGSGSAPMRAEHRATRASALRASTHQPSSPPGMTGSCSARRSNALATTAPWPRGAPRTARTWMTRRSTTRTGSGPARPRGPPGGTDWPGPPLCLIAPQDTPLGPGDQPSLGLGGGEPGELHHLVDAELPRGERLGDLGESLQGVGRGDPPPGLPIGDAVAHPQPVGHVPCP